LLRKQRAQQKAVEAFLRKWEREYNRKLKEAERLKAKKKRERAQAAKARLVGATVSPTEI
jgi:hypothetical protein